MTEEVKNKLQSYLKANLKEEAYREVMEVSVVERMEKLVKAMGGDEEAVVETVSGVSGMEFLRMFEVDRERLKGFPFDLVRSYNCLPIKTKEGFGMVSTWVPSGEWSQWVNATVGMWPRWYLAKPSMIREEVNRIFGVGFESLEGEDAEMFEEEGNGEEEDSDAAIIKFVNQIIIKAMEDRATDIHFEPQKEVLQIRNRIDGDLIPVQLPDRLKRYQAAIISRLKIMSKLNISEKRRPQDGRIKFKRQGGDIDIRVSTFPTNFGESVSLRLLNQENSRFTLDSMGLLPDDQLKIAPIIYKPHGIILVTGPTGSGKSTSLSCVIREIQSPERRIITVEDPIENEIEGVNQTQIRPEIGLDFANALRHILRQDPDIIMIGEIRDRETAEIAIRASLTGHLVLSTLHTNDSAGALTRLIDMEIEPFLLASSVEMIIAQRLVRKLCPECSKPAEMMEGELERNLEALGVPASELKYRDRVREPVGCVKCNGLGYRGRVGIFEILIMDEEIHQLVVQRKPARVMRQVAIDNGMRTLQQCGWEQVKLGRTTLKAILKFAELEHAE